MAETAAQVLQHIPQDAAVAQALNPATADPARQMSIKEAWEKTVATVGPVTYDTDPSALPENAEAHAADEEKPAEEPKPEQPKKAAKAKAESAPAAESEETEATDEEEGEEPGDGKKPTPAELRAHIDWRVKERQRFERRERAQEQRFTQREKQLRDFEQRVQSSAQQYAPLVKVAQAIELGDFDGIAKGLAEFTKNEAISDWNTLNSEALKAMQTPLYKQMRTLQVQQEEGKKQLEQERQRQTQAYAEQQRQQEVSNWKRGIVEELSNDEDPAVAAIIDARPQLADAVFNIQNQHYHQSGGELLSARDAAVQLLKNVRDDFQFWSDLFEEHGESNVIKMLTGSQVAPKKKPAVSGGSQRAETSERRVVPKKPTKTVSQTQTAQASAIPEMTPEQLKKFYTQKMQEDFQHIR